ncbi:MAG: hypothetical protein U0263_18775 [Polyangiaceae bacterium]
MRGLALLGLGLCAIVASCGETYVQREAASVGVPRPEASTALEPATPPRARVPEHARLPCSEPGDAGPPTSLRDVDWCNFEYLPSVWGLRAGRGEVHEYLELGGVHDTDLYELRSVSYVDLVGDGSEQALIVVDEQHYAGAAQHSWNGTLLYLFEWRDGGARRVADLSAPRASEARVETTRVVLTFERQGKRCEQRYELRASRLEPAGTESCR